MSYVGLKEIMVARDRIAEKYGIRFTEWACTLCGKRYDSILYALNCHDSHEEKPLNKTT